MTNNARIVREALEFYADPLAWVRSQMVFPRPETEKDLMCDGPSPADADCGHEARAALAALAALESEFAAFEADLERAREEEARLLLKVRDAIIQGDTDEAYHLIYMFASFIAPNPHQPWEGLESRSALAPKQKGE